MTKDCGIYVATKAIPAGDDMIDPPRLVYFHNHSQQGDPMVILPEKNTNNRWEFGEKGFLVSNSEFIDGLTALKAEGLYRVREHFHPNDDQMVEKDALVQLGYNGAGEAIIFFPTLKDGTNSWEFPVSGMKVPAKIYELLEPLSTRGIFVPKQKHVH